MVLPSQRYFLESQHSLIQEEGRHKNMADTKKNKKTLPLDMTLDMSECHGGIESSLEFLPSIHFTDLVEMLNTGLNCKTPIDFSLQSAGEFRKYPIKEPKIDMFKEIKPTAPFTHLHNPQTALLQISIITLKTVFSAYFLPKFN